MTEPGKIVISSALSVLAHLSLFTALALMPESVAVPLKPEPKPLEVTFEPAPRPAPASPQVAEVKPVLPQAESIPTQLDPENLKKADQAPEHPTEIAAHDSQAAPPKPAPTPPPDLSSLALQPVPKPEEEAGIAALGNYGKAVGNPIGARWEYYQKTHKNLPAGEVLLKFAIDAQGRVSSIRVLSPGANAEHISLAERAVKEAKIPPIPPQRLAQVPGGCIEITYKFILY